MTRSALWLATLLALAPSAQADERAAFISQTAAEAGVTEAEVQALLDQAKRQDSILAAISRPAEAKPWHAYRPIFLDPGRIRAGQAFLAEHGHLLAEVEAATGVPATLIVAIIGVETNYGRNTGSHRVLDALYTLGFHYPPRQDFFRRELARLVLLGKTEALDVTALKGSYAGAMGWGQFMPSSYLNFAVDGDGDGTRDLFGSLPDVFASIANYFVAHGWQGGEPVAVAATLDGETVPTVPTGLEPTTTIAELAAAGLRATGADPGAERKAAVLALAGVDGPEYWLTFGNFHAITRYNRSPLYAMAVHQLALAIAAEGTGTAP